ncbi:MAG: alcohol dehydrogenase catalytic domain-containing protein [Chloroflexota bacterium]
MVGLIKQAAGSENVGLGEMPRPTAGPGEVVVEVIATGICGTDLHIIHDEYVSNPPMIMGHEITGWVRELGEGVDPDWLGKRIAPETYYYTCDRCPRCLEGRRNLCPHRRSIGSHVNGGFARWVLVPVRNLHPVHASVGELAGALYEPLACVANALCDPAVASPGDAALVIGPGAMGIITAQVLQAQGADVLLSGTARDAARLEIARSMGIRTVDAADAEAAAPGLGFDLAVDCSGAAAGIRTGLRATRKGGRYVQIGVTGKPIEFEMDQVFLKELVVTSGFASTPRSWRRAVALVAGGHVQLDPLITQAYALADWKEAFDRTARADCMKLVIDPRLGGAA